MERDEYAALALSGDLSVEELEVLESENLDFESLMLSGAPISEAKLKNVRKSFTEAATLLAAYPRFITYKQEEYPQCLKNIYSPPPVIFYEGNPALLWAETSLAMVGSRKADRYGVTAARDFARVLSQLGLTIVSGLAVGIDAASHEGALQGSGRTVGVLGTGIDVVYPATNGGLSAQVKSSGCVVSEFLPGTPPLKQNFPRRNRIIVGLSKAVFVVQAGLRSGSLITARLAAENGRDVFALPGDVNRENSKGTNWLLKNGSKVITEYEDIIEEFPRIEATLKLDKKQVDSPVLTCLGNGPLTFGELLLSIGCSSKSLMVELTELQLEGLIYEERGRWNRS